MKKLHLYLLFLIFPFHCIISQQQKVQVTPVSIQKIDADIFEGYDGLGNSYYIKNNIFFKKDENNIWQYKNVTLGKITKVDLQNPLKIVLFYENFNSVVLLDNQLNEVQKINFSKNPIPLVVTATGISSQNQLWVYDSLNQQIGLFDYLKNNYKAVSTSFPESIKMYQSDFNTFYWIDNNNNWFSCDIFGKITTKGKIADFDFIEIINDQQFIYSKNNVLIFEDLKKKGKYKIEISEKTFQKFYYKDQILSIFTSKGIINYKITTP